MAIYQCRQCEREEYLPRPYQYHFGNKCRCPSCGTYRVVRLQKPDKIDKMHTGFLNWAEKMLGGTLHSCCFCRLQFYDRRRIATAGETRRRESEMKAVAQPQDPARSDASRRGLAPKHRRRCFCTALFPALAPQVLIVQ
jgi:hypothetical protein